MDNATRADMDVAPQDRPVPGDTAPQARRMTASEFIASDAFEAAVLEASRIGVARAMEAERPHQLGAHPAPKQ